MRVILFFIFLAVFASFPSQSHAVGNLHKGGTELHPAISISQRYDDNIYLSDDELIAKESDSLTVISPSIELKRDHGGRLFLFNYGAQIYRYARQSDEDRESHLASILFDSRFPGGLRLRLQDTYRQTAEAASSELTDRDERAENLIEVALSSRVFDRLSFELSYTGTTHDYKEGSDKLYLKQQDRFESSYGGNIIVRLLPKTSAFLAYREGAIDYKTTLSGDERDSASRSFALGLKGQLTSKVNIDIMGGYIDRKYKSAAKTDFSSEILSMAINYDFSSLTAFTLMGERRLEESFFFDIAGNSSNFFVANRISLGMKKKITHKITFDASASYELNDYPVDVDRIDSIYGAILDLRYYIKPWLNTAAAYSYMQRNSDLDPLLYPKDYRSNTYSISLNAAF